MLVYPDSADVQTMNELLNLSLAEPEEGAPYKNFELPGGNKHIFTYVATCDGNRDYFSSLISRDNTEYDGFESADSSVAAVNTAPAVKVSAEELCNELCELRVQKLFDWAEGLDARAKEMGASISGAVDKLIHEAALENELLSIAQGMTTDYDDDISMSFVDFYNKYTKDNDYSFAQELINRLGLKDSNTLDACRGYSVKRNTNSHYQVISLHSFDTHKDYYLNSFTRCQQYKFGRDFNFYRSRH